ncbi:MAG: C_GCAxxG_C_C family protein [Pseudomonadales bacterium]|nr:C_GCAxxG_C_C family protein [Pseudomonadales bacterium]
MGQERLNRDNPELIKAVGIYGGGISATGDLCGAVLGGMALFSSLYSRSGLDEKESPELFRLGRMLDAAFEEITREYGGKDCADIARVDWTDPDQVQAFYRSPDSRRVHCRKVVGETARALGELIDREMADK